MGTTDKPGEATEALSPALQSRDILAGLGAAPRHLLATCLALFEDSTLQQRLGERVEGLKRKLTGSRSGTPDESATVTSLQRRVMAWMQSSSSDQELRLILWTAFGQACIVPDVDEQAVLAALRQLIRGEIYQRGCCDI